MTAPDNQPEGVWAEQRREWQRKVRSDAEARAWEMLCDRLQRDPIGSEYSDTCTLRSAMNAMVAFSEATTAAAVAAEREVLLSGVCQFIRNRAVVNWGPDAPENIPEWRRGWIGACEQLPDEIRRMFARTSTKGER